MRTGLDALRIVRDLMRRHGRWPTVDEFAAEVRVEPSPDLAEALENLRGITEQLTARLREGRAA